MKKLVAATTFAAVAFAAQSTAACDWNHEASTEQQQVATSAAPTQTPQVTSTATQAPTVTAETREPAQPTAPVVLVNDRR